ncbi:hypothetical protein CDL15_Pgr003945 [Punica granatum]|uniref:Uncharacterized protein n=1 Tax=Punica granatum TaxID=22663 RepID=A0A218XMW3_PUNGR|nr:hypothetical protein CDL15_Pgr003945 [Punica granatum]
MRQFGSLQTVPEDTARYLELPYFPEHPTQDERDFQATEEYILRFYRRSSLVHEDFTGSPQPEGSTPYGAPSTSSITVQAELTSLRSERDRLRWEVAEKDEQLIDQRQLQRELAQARAELQRRDQELARVNVTMEVPTHLRINISTRLSPGIGVFRGNVHLCPERDGRST